MLDARIRVTPPLMVIRFAPETRARRYCFPALNFGLTPLRRLAVVIQQQPIRIEIDTVDALQLSNNSSSKRLRMKISTLLQTLLSQHQPASCVVFCNAKEIVQAVCDALNAVGQSALALHGDLEQRDRDQTLVRFCDSQRILVATDVAARGLNDANRSNYSG